VMEPKIKLSDNPDKVTLPGCQALYRLYTADGMAAADLIALSGEEFDFSMPLTIFDPKDTWKKLTLSEYRVKKLLEPLITAGVASAVPRSLKEIQAYRKCEEDSIWDQYLRLVNPNVFKVDLSDRLWALRHKMLHSHGGTVN
jgi:nicotinate phosphoribosyltransferase